MNINEDKGCLLAAKLMKILLKENHNMKDVMIAYFFIGNFLKGVAENQSFKSDDFFTSLKEGIEKFEIGCLKDLIDEDKK